MRSEISSKAVICKDGLMEALSMAATARKGIYNSVLFVGGQLTH
jgi:hypothetical protein